MNFLVNTGWLVLAGMYFKGIPYVLDIFAARTFSISQYGQLAFILSFVALFNILFDFGLNDYTVREVAKKNESAKDHLNRLIWVKFGLGLVNVALIIGVAQLIGQQELTLWLVLLAALYLLFNNQTLFLHAFFRAHQIMQWEAVSKFVQATLLIFLGIAVLWSTQSLYWYLAAFVVSALLGWGVTMGLVSWRISRFWPQIDVAFVKASLLGSIPFAISTFFIEIYYYVDTVILGSYHGEIVAGYYKSAYNILVIFTLLLATIMGGLLPIIARVLVKTPEKLPNMVRTIFLALTIGIIPVVLGLYWGAPEIVKILYGDKFAVSADILRILVWSLLPMYVYAIFSLVLTITNRVRTLVLASIAGAVFNFGANLYLIPQYGYQAAALTTIATEVLVGLVIVISFFSRSPLNNNEIPQRSGRRR